MSTIRYYRSSVPGRPIEFLKINGKGRCWSRYNGQWQVKRDFGWTTTVHCTEITEAEASEGK